MATTPATATEVRVYWRPGCGFCAVLRRKLHKAGLATTELNIWDDPDAAEFVRSHAGGNETVPTVAIGDSVFVNPPARHVLEMAERAGITWQAPAAREHWWSRAPRAASGGAEDGGAGREHQG
jgi:glutaredoxin-like protein